MSRNKKFKQPKTFRTPSTRKQPRAVSSVNEESPNTKMFAFSLSIFDEDDPWGWNKGNSQDWVKIVLPKLKFRESMTWQEILNESGGKKKGRGNHHHPVPIEKLSREAQKRLETIRRDEVGELFSLRLDARKRLWGIRDGHVLKLLWYDANHQVCPCLS